MVTETPPKKALKRARPVHSCIPCRNKKLKCDRRAPCEMCVKAERPELCRYDASIGSMSRADDAATDDDAALEQRPAQVRRLGDSTYDAGDGASAVPAFREARGGVIEELQARVDRLESIIASPETILSNGPHQVSNPDTWIPGTVEYKDGRSKFRPLGHKSAILYRFQEAKNYIGTKVNDPATVATLKGLRKNFPKEPRLNTREAFGRRILPQIFDLLPQKVDCDELTRTFFDETQVLLCVLDRHQFYGQYEAYWNLPAQQRANSPFSVCLLLTAALGSLINTYSKTMSLKLVVDLVEDWLHGIGGKDLSDLLTLQIETLHVLASQASGIISEQVYRTSGRLVRSALISGLQYDPGTISQVPEDEVNVRRGLWTAIAELDLQASLICGLPCTLGGGDYTCKPPVDRPELGRTLGDTLSMRLEGARLMRLKPGEQSRAMQCIKSLEQAQAAEQSESTPLTKAFFDVIIHRSIVSFARPLLEGQTLAYVRLSSCRTSLIILKHLEMLKDKPPLWTFFFAICNQDIFQAVLITCLNLRARNIEASITPPQPLETLYSIMPKATELTSAVENAVNTLLTHIASEHVGEYIKDLIVLSVVKASANFPTDSTTQHIAMEDGFNRVIESMHERTKRTPGLSPAESGQASSLSDSFLEFDNIPWVPGPNFSFDFGAPLEHNFGFENGLLNNIGNDLQWTNM